MSPFFQIAGILSLLAPSYGRPALDISFPQHPPATANVVDDNFIGISWELSSFDTLWGKTVDTIPPAMQNYLHNIVARMSKPLRIRIGGNGMDGSTYIPTLPTFLELTDPNAYFNDVPVNFGPIMFDVMNRMYDTVGPMQFILGLSMRTPDNTSNLLTLAAAAEDKLGDRLDAFLLGNEPDLYAGHGERGSYDIPTYVTEVGEVLNDLQKAGDLNRTLIGGPTICCGWNLSTILDAGLDRYPYKYYTMQRYPQQNCGGPNPQNTNISYYLSHQNLVPYLNWQQEGMAKARQKNVPVLMTEYNTVACGGSNISNTFAASLWAVDVGLKAASMNYSAVFLHTREYGVTYNLFDPPTPETSVSPGWKTGAVYYSALFLAEVTDPTGSIIVDLNLNNSNSSPASKVAAYGIYHDSGASRGKLALLNFADGADPGEAASQVYRIPEGVFESIDIRVLSAPSVVERENISWAGQTVGDIGNLVGTQDTMSVNCAGGCSVEVPSPGAALVYGSGSYIFTGNTTIAGPDRLMSGSTSTILTIYDFNVALAFVFICMLCV